MLARSSFHVGDSNPIIQALARELSSRERALVVLDPYGLQVRWETVAALGSSGKADVFINFSQMGVIRTLRRTGGPAPGFRSMSDGVMAD